MSPFNGRYRKAHFTSIWWSSVQRFLRSNTMDLPEAFDYPAALETFRENHQRDV